MEQIDLGRVKWDTPEIDLNKVKWDEPTIDLERVQWDEDSSLNKIQRGYQSAVLKVPEIAIGIDSLFGTNIMDKDSVAKINSTRELLDKQKEETSQANISPDRKLEIDTLRQEAQNAKGTWDNVKMGARQMYDVAVHPSEWTLQGVTEGLLAPENIASFGVGTIATKATTLGAKTLFGSLAGAVENVSLGTPMDYLQAKGQGKTDEEAKNVAIQSATGNTLGGAMFGGAGGMASGLMKGETPEVVKAPTVPDAPIDHMAFLDSTKPLKASEELGLKPEEAKVAETISEQNNIPIEEATKIVEDAKNIKSLDEQMELIRTHDKGGEEQAQTYKAQMQSWADRENANRVEQGLEPTVTADDMARQNFINYENKARPTEAELNTLFETATDANGNFKTIGDRNKSHGWQDTQNTDAYGQEYTTRMAGERGLDSEVTTPVSTLKKLKEEGYNALNDAERAMVDRDIDTIRNHPDFKTLEQMDGTRLNENGELVDADGNYLFQSAYHGTPHNVDKFSTDKIGTGEGAQAYGHGLYFADSKSVAEFYQKKLSSKILTWGTEQEKAIKIAINRTKNEWDKQWLQKFYNDINTKSPREIDDMAKMRLSDGAYDRFYKAVRNGEYKSSNGNLYKVDLKPKEEEYLQWDKPLSEQSLHVREKLKGLVLDDSSSGGKTKFLIRQFNEGNLDKIYPRELMEALGNGNYESILASEKLDSLGIKGVKYLDNNSRAKGDGNHNYVIFNDKDVEVIGANGKHYDPSIPDTLFQGEKYPQGVKGAYSIDSKLIQIFESHDVSTLNHELGHRFLHTLSEKEFSVASEIFGVKDGKWTREQHEAFADAYARYIAEGKTPVKGLKAIFDKFKKFTIEILKSLKENNGGKMPKLSPEMKEFFSATLGHEPSRAKLFERIKEKESKADMGDGTLYQTASQKEHLKEVYKDSHPLTKNEDGTPKVFYHGTGADIPAFDLKFVGDGNDQHGSGFYFTSDASEASGYASTFRSTDNGNILPVYLKIKNPIIVKDTGIGGTKTKQKITPSQIEKIIKNSPDFEDNLWNFGDWEYEGKNKVVREAMMAYSDRTSSALDVMNMLNNDWYRGKEGEFLQQFKKATGYDGVSIDFENGNRHIVSFDPNNIKSIHNKPLSEGKSPDFENSNILYQQYKKGQLPNAKSLPDETKLELVQRKLQDKFNRVTKLLESKADINKLDDAMNPYQAEELYHGRVEARIQDFEKSTVKPIIELISESKHTIEEVDAYLHARHAIERNKKMLDDNGVIDGSGMSDAEAIDIINHYANNPKMNEIAQKVYAMNRERLKLIKQEGLETDEFITKIDGTYNHYVPLKRIMDNTQQGMRTGRGYDIKGKEVKRAKGSDRAVESPLMNSILSYQETLIRAEKNKVGQAMYEFTQAYPDSSLYTVKGVQHAPMYDKFGDVVGINPQYKLDDNVLHVKIDGKVKEITFHDPLLATAFKNLNADQMSNAMILVQKATRFLASVNTQYNPEFVIGNFERDLQTALINLPKEVKGNRLIIAKDVGSAIKGIYGSVRERKTNKWGILFEEMKREGGTTGWIEQYNVSDMKAKTEAMIRRYDGKFMPKDAFLETLRYIDDVNTAVENGTRLVAYKMAKESGLSNKKSASIAKNLTVNFNRKGEASTGINAMYMFFNASVQGSTRMITALKHSNTAKAIAGGIIGASIGLNYYNNSVNAEAYEKIPDYEKDTNYIFMKEDGTYYKVKIPYGYNLFKTMGDVVADGMQSNVKLEDMPKRLFNATLNAMSPMGGGNSDFVQSISPTIVRPAVDLALNKNFAGQNIMPEDSPYAPSTTPDAYKYFKSVNPIAKNVAQGLNKATGGNLHKSGAIDVSPETLEYLTEAITGGLGKLISRSITTGSKLINDEKVDMNKVPFARILMGEPNEKFEQSKFYEMYKKSGLNEFDAKDKQKFLKYGQVAVQKGDIEPKTFVSMLKQFVSNQQKINWADTNDVQSYDQVKQNPEMLNGVPKGEIKKIVKGDKKAGQ